MQMMAAFRGMFRGVEVHDRREGGMTMRPKRHQDMNDVLVRRAQLHSETDVLGSWTGVPWDEDEEPVQDADDL